MTDTMQATPSRSAAGEARRSPGPSPALLQRRIRTLHLYLGMLFAPSVLFFAVTGALQLFGLHEVRPDRAFEPPAILQELGMVHKDQVFAMPRRKGPRPPAAEASAPAALPTVAPPDAERQPSWKPLALKVFFLFASIGLFLSTCLGIWVGLRPGRHRGIGLSLLVAGAVIPVLLLAL